VRPLACNWYYCAVYSQAQGCVCTALQLGGDVKQPWLMSKYVIIHKTGSTQRITTPPEQDRATATYNTQKIGQDQTRSSEDMIADKRTQTDRHAHHDTPLGGGVNNTPATPYNLIDDGRYDTAAVISEATRRWITRIILLSS